MKVNARNNIIRELANSKWGCKATTLRPSCLALCYSAAEYACPSVGKVYTRAQAEPGPTRLLPNHIGLPQTNELGQRTHTGRYRSSSHQEDCCLPHGTHTTNDGHQLFHHQPAASRLKSRKSFMRTVTPLDSSASSGRLLLWKDSLTDVPASVKMGLQLEVAESLPDHTGSGEDWLCWRALNRLRTGVGRAKTVTTPSRWIATAWSHRRWSTSSPTVY